MAVRIIAVSLFYGPRREAYAFDSLFDTYRSAKNFLRENGYSQSDPESIHWDQVNINGEDVLIIDQNIRDIQAGRPAFSVGVPNLGSFDYFVLRKVDTSAQDDFSDNHFSETTSSREQEGRRWFSNAELTEALLSDTPNPDLLEGRFEPTSAATNPPVNTEQFLTVGQLKAALEGVPDDVVVSVPSWGGEENSIDYTSTVRVGRIGFEGDVGVFIGDHESDDDLDDLTDITPTVTIE